MSTKGLSNRESTSSTEPANESTKVIKTNHQVNVSLPNAHKKVEKSLSFQPATRKLSNQFINSGHHPSSQPDLTSMRGGIQRPNSHSGLEFQPPSALNNSTCILHHMVCMPPSSLESTTSVIPKSMQRPSSIPPRTIHPSLRSHFAIEKSTDISMPQGISNADSRAATGECSTSKRNQPITKPLLHNSDTPPVRLKQSYQHLHEQAPRRGSRNVRIETDIM